MSELPTGLYEVLLTELLSSRVTALAAGQDAQLDTLRNAEAADRIALHLATVIERAINALPEDDRATVGTQLARHLIANIASAPQLGNLKRIGDVTSEQPAVPPRLLRAVHTKNPDGSPLHVDIPLIPLLDTTLLTNSPGEPRVGRQILSEIASADRIDVVMAFVRRTGIRPLRDALQRHVDAGRALRVLTTTYTGSTEAEALDMLESLGALIRVSYDTSTTRLHAKAWLFHRDSGFSSAYVGSSNLTHSAQEAGLEWNVRVSGARNRSVIDKVAAVFESYWQQSEFEPYNRERFVKAIARDAKNDGAIWLPSTEIYLYPFQERLLEQIELSRSNGRHRNLLVAATGTGKTVMAAIDYARLRAKLPRARLLFVAHREEILRQSLATFAHALRDPNFGELWVGGKRPTQFEHVFASIQSLDSNGLESLHAEHFDVVIIDEFHHAAASSYVRLLEAIEPNELLGLTATPERSDGLSLLHHFDGRISAELRLWDAIDQQRLTPFAYYGIADSLDLREIPWRRGRGYDVEGVTKLITANDVWARGILKQFMSHIGSVSSVRAMGFCVSVEHARYMARVFAEHGVPSEAVWADTPEHERKDALAKLASGTLQVVFSVDLFNEGVDVPSLNTLLMLRPTDSPVLFLQQLGRGLRRSEGKSICTVLDFVGQHRKEFRFDRKLRALLGGTRSGLREQVEAGFPFLPAGCHMELDRVSSERVLKSIAESVPSKWKEKAEELRAFAKGRSSVSLAEFLEESDLELDDVYSGDRSWSDLREAAGLALHETGPHEEKLRRASGRLLHVDDAERLDTWRRWLREDVAPDVNAVSERERKLLRMLLVQCLNSVDTKSTSLRRAAKLLWQHPQVRHELVDLFDALSERVSHVTDTLARYEAVPLRVHANYSRLEILAAVSGGDGVDVRRWQEGVLYSKEIKADLFVFTLDKTRGQFSPTTRYRDYAISRELVHWESQSRTRQSSEDGMRYREHVARGSGVLLFARLRSDDRAFHFLGPATYVSHFGEQPMAITWRLMHKLPGDLFQAFAAAVA